MTREDLIKRKKELEDLKTQHLENKKQIEVAMLQTDANIQACNGAIQDCDYWLEKLGTKSEEKKPSKKMEKVTT